MPLVYSPDHPHFGSTPTTFGSLCRRAAEFGIALMVAVQGTFAFGFSQEEITTAALNTFTAEAATYDWNTHFDQYFNGVPDDPNTPVNEFIQRYDAGPFFGWGESYLSMAQRAMFDATDETQYLDLLLDGAETMYDNRSDRLTPPLRDIVRNNTIRPAFITFRYNPGTQHAWLVHSAFASHPVTYAISTINSDPQLQSGYGPGAVETYGERAAALTVDIIQTMDSFDADFDPNGGGCTGCGEYYEPYLDFNSPYTNGQSPYNMQSAAGSTYVGLWNATGEQRFYDRAVSLAKTLKEEFTLAGDRYEWRYAPYNPSGSAGDISHAGLDVNFVVDAYEAGIVFDDTDIQRLANTMRHIQVGNGFAYRLDGVAGATDYTHVAWLWQRLARYDSVLREEMYPVFQDYWNGSHAAANPLFPTVGSALLYETGQPYTLEESFNDSFAGLQIDARWRRPSSQPIGNTWKAQSSGSQLVVSDIATTSKSDQWVDIRKTRDVQQDDSWEVTYDFSWDSADGGSDPLQAMQRFIVELRDFAGDLIAKVGINDMWNQHSGGREIQLFDQTIIEPFDSLGLAGSAAVKIISDAAMGFSEIYWDNSLILSIPQIAALQQVAMDFGHYTGPSVTSHFGTISVDSLSVNDLTLPGDFNGDGSINATDYTVWRDTLGASVEPFTGADATGDGLVTVDDYHHWRNGFIFAAPVGATGKAAVPEPSGATLLGGMMALLAIQRIQSACRITKYRSKRIVDKRAIHEYFWDSCMHLTYALDVSECIYRAS